MMWTKAALATLLAAGLTVSATSAQDNLVAVDLSPLHAQIARNLDIEPDEIPMALDLPVALAADVCGIWVESLTGSCTATDMMWATRYASQAVDGDPFSSVDDDDPDRASGDVLLDAPSSSTNTAAQHGS